MYILKEDMSKMIRSKFKNTYISNTLGLSATYVSLVLNRHKSIPKRMAYSFTKLISSEYEIEDLFDVVD